ncbi:MAG: DUF2339 domain-containing protein [Candidatus Falkowbacteria bacterium]
MLYFIIFVLIIYLLFAQAGIKRQLRDLMQAQEAGKPMSAVAKARSKAAAMPLPPGMSEEDVQKALMSKATKTVPKAVINKPTLEGNLSVDSFFAWFKEDWLMKLGALFLLIGFGWLVTYAFLNNWIGPIGRIMIGLLAGSLFLVWGWYRIKEYINQGGVLMILGSSTILLTVYAAREMYDFFNPTIALVIMFLSVAFVSLAGVRAKNRMISLMGLLMACVVPLLVGSTETNYFFLFSYLLVIVLGSLWVAAVSGWRSMVLGALVMTMLYGGPLIDSGNANTPMVLIFVYIFAAVFLLSSLLVILKNAGKLAQIDMAIAALNSMYLLLWIIKEVPEEWRSLIVGAWLLVFVVSAFIVFRKTEKPEPVYLYSGIALVFLGAATAIEFKTDVLPVAYSLEVVAMAFLTRYLFKNVRSTSIVACLILLPCFLSLRNMANYSREGGLGADFWVILIVGACVTALATLFKYMTKEDDSVGHDCKTLAAFSYIIASLYAYFLIWFGFTQLWPDFGGIMASLIIYTIVGLIAYFYGMNKNGKVLRVYGLCLLIFVIARMMLIDVWRMDITGRIVTFFSIGILMLGTALLKINRKK